MSVRSELLFAAQKKILNSFLLCAVTSARARQLMVARDGRAAVAELVDETLSEIAAGALEFGCGKPMRGQFVGAESKSEEATTEIESRDLQAVSAANVSRESPHEAVCNRAKGPIPQPKERCSRSFAEVNRS